MNKNLERVIILGITLIILSLIMLGCGRSSFYQSSRCTVDEVDSGAIISCEDGSTAVIYDGEDGEDGMDAVSPILYMLDPCGDHPGHVDELLIVTDSGVIAWYKNIGLVLIEPNVRYRTTDKQKCTFEINSDYELVFEQE